VVCTKGGYLTPDGAMPADANRYFFDEYIQRGCSRRRSAAGAIAWPRGFGKPVESQPEKIWRKLH